MCVIKRISNQASSKVFVTESASPNLFSRGVLSSAFLQTCSPHFRTDALPFLTYKRESRSSVRMEFRGEGKRVDGWREDSGGGGPLLVSLSHIPARNCGTCV